MIDYTVSSSFSEVVLSVRVAFSKRSWPYLLAAAVPWLLCAGQRCMTRIAKLALFKRSLSGYYRFLSDGLWRMELFFRFLFELIVKAFKVVELTLVLDDTLSPKWGRGIFGTGSFFDHARRPRPGYIWGHNWVVLAVVIQVGSAAWVALPFWVALYRPKKTCPRKEFRTRHELAVEALKRVRTWFPGPIALVADGAYDNDSLVTPARELDMTVVSRIRSDARLRAPEPGPQPKGKRGRKPKRGPRLPKLATLARQWSKFTAEQVTIYGKQVTLRLREVVAYWPALGRVVKVVIARDPNRPKRTAYLMATDLAMSAAAVVEMFARRWTIEQLFSAAKNQMGFDSAEVRKERSVLRHAALTMGLITMTEVWAHRSRPTFREKSFAAKLAALREEAVKGTIFASGPRRKGSGRISRRIAQLFSTALSAA